MALNYFCCRPQTDRVPDGFYSPNNKAAAVTIIFTAVLPKEIWKWDNDTSHVYMRFSNMRLGAWKYDFGPGILVRYEYGHINLQVTK